MPSSIDIARLIRAVVLDVDGVLTDGRVMEGTPFKAKWRSYYDGQGISLLRAAGLQIALVTSESGVWAQPFVEVVDKWNSLRSSGSEENPDGWPPVTLFTGQAGLKKVEVVEVWLSQIDIRWQECAAMGDDVVDAPLLQKAALSAAPISADPHIKKLVHFVSERPGGYGAFRDFANFILEAKGIDPLTLAAQ